MWNLKIMDAVTSDRAYGIKKGKKRARIFPRACARGWSKGNHGMIQAEWNHTADRSQESACCDGCTLGASPLRTAMSRMWFKSEPRRYRSGRARSR
jgi:hypothetical protein